ncbi:Uncharacterised protein [Vibrio cholerae]|uniref:Uncharacterized protein n=1 Tax=Vibrio cholerae TaxID=666 RepID=A0A655X9K2_VIBCL|nr:Uncharacterised protein [Vibrio cholerae]CSA45071.1 Uncharacterised protein [Vibrio cholerae]CSA45534.1 Uncharacterised protein [Vibrio cholerae]CSA91565.1 Uncharacterised protein [Vibrio cholerae]CSB23282.1 Uncharacterised protein [Vibrio cholerae]
MDAFSKGRGFEFRTRVTPRFIQLLDDVGHGGYTKVFIGVIDRAKSAQELCIANQRFQIFAVLLSDSFHHRIRFWVHR